MLNAFLLYLPNLKALPNSSYRRAKSFQAKTVAEAKAKISSQSNLPLTFATIVEALDILRGAVSIVYPMGLPEYDPIRMEFENREELAGQFSRPCKFVLGFLLCYHVD